ncbi:SET domain-containing protein [Armillaria solidipes]|uniref:SET domain-containing protein n=1 Tax=Armillaria solidipes TaxID=1076256 RepID=A0A2H3C085_9AGAR|nr:SET domain-containing protein [Armillaria solidipes]
MHAGLEECRKESYDMTLSAECLPFVPFADDPTFPLVEYAKRYESFEWQVDFVDPDVEVIEIEVARRLHCEFGLSLNAIDELKIIRPMRLSHDSGLIWDTFQRDMPDIPWLDEPVIMTLPPRKLPSENDLLNEINRFRPQFCPSMNCIHLAFEYPPINPITPTKTNQSLKLQQGALCGPDCYRHLDESQDGMMEGVQWTDPEDEEFLQGVLKLDPDISPCALAIICRKRCFEVYIYRTRLIPDEKVIIGEPEEPQNQRRLVFYDDNLTDDTTYVPQRYTHLEIKRGAYGLGAFAKREMKRETKIGEYVGEILYLSFDGAQDLNELIHNHTGVNYAFEANASDNVRTIDAGRLGNETRYLNHSKKPNCYTRPALVNGEYRLLLTTDKKVKKNQELFLDYGKAYWKGKEPGEEGNGDEMIED